MRERGAETPGHVVVHVVFASTAQQARVVAAEIAKKAYRASSYCGGTVKDLVGAGLIAR